MLSGSPVTVSTRLSFALVRVVAVMVTPLTGAPLLSVSFTVSRSKSHPLPKVTVKPSSSFFSAMVFPLAKFL